MALHHLRNRLDYSQRPPKSLDSAAFLFEGVAWIPFVLSAHAFSPSCAIIAIGYTGMGPSSSRGRGTACGGENQTGR